MANSDLKVGDTVLLSEGTDWGINEYNPLNTKGIVSTIWDEWVRVRWFNGNSNASELKASDLILVDNTIKLFEAEYGGESLYDYYRDSVEAVNPDYNTLLQQIPQDEHGFMKGKFKVSITWEET